MSGEFQRIRQWFLPLAQPAANPPAVLSNGDDALAVRTDETLVMSVDSAVEGTHFLASAAPQDIATKALRAALSDLAAMGARPWFYTLALTVPDHLPDAWWSAFSAALLAENHHWSFPCLGGDTTRGPCLVVTVQVQGLCARPLTRSGGEPGDHVWVTDTLGGSAAGLQHMLAGEALTDSLAEAFYRPSLPLKLMQRLNPRLNAAIDVSDGLGADLSHLLAASECGARVDLTQLPLAPELISAYGREKALAMALSGGEDYCTCFTARPDQAEEIHRAAAELGTPVTRIGELTAEPGLQLHDNQTPYQPDWKGYDHFG